MRGRAHLARRVGAPWPSIQTDGRDHGFHPESSRRFPDSSSSPPTPTPSPPVLSSYSNQSPSLPPPPSPSSRASFLDWSSDHRTDEQQQQQKQTESEDQLEASANSSGSQTMVETPSADYVTPYAPHEVGHAMGQIAYPNNNPYYGSLYAAYGGQPMMHPPLVGMHPTGLPLPTDAIEEPVYVNAKQYNAILRRRQSRAKAESEKKHVKGRKPYLHESRHQHALKRARGAGGRFLNSKSDDKEEHSDSSSKEKQNGVAPHNIGQPSPKDAFSANHTSNRE